MRPRNELNQRLHRWHCEDRQIYPLFGARQIWHSAIVSISPQYKSQEGRQGLSRLQPDGKPACLRQPNLSAHGAALGRDREFATSGLAQRPSVFAGWLRYRQRAERSKRRIFYRNRDLRGRSRQWWGSSRAGTVHLDDVLVRWETGVFAIRHPGHSYAFNRIDWGSQSCGAGFFV